MTRWLALAVGLLIAAPLWAPASVAAQSAPATKRKQKQKAKGSHTSREPDRRSPNHFKSLTKVRRGSVLSKDPTEMPVADLRSELERRRDHELIVHYRRLAQLDVIAHLATSDGDTKLAGRAEEVRRLEIERFRLAMYHLRALIQTKRQTGLP